MKRKFLQSLTVASLGLILSFSVTPASAQENNNTAKGEMKTSGSEVKRAGTTAGHNLKRGRVVRAGKRFGKHTGRAGKHFGRGTKKATKKVVKRVIS
ncbi:MAG: hypothetical protein ACR2H4_13395 [Pyrinomonadaceae bacterium]